MGCKGAMHHIKGQIGTSLGIDIAKQHSTDMSHMCCMAPTSWASASVLISLLCRRSMAGSKVQTHMPHLLEKLVENVGASCKAANHHFVPWLCEKAPDTRDGGSVSLSIRHAKSGAGNRSFWWVSGQWLNTRKMQHIH